jgi:hypothetical protein|tara:strand:- start:678 stop:1406 length:729 start_codon:yes stop_codon:yes gene_type:complete
MAVNIDTVYQRVLAAANKEQRGYVTPQEFNLYANQVQMDIFEQYFYDLNAFQKIPGNDSTYADMVDVIQEKIDVFEKYRQPVVLGANGVATMPEYYRMGELYTNACGDFVEIEKLNQNEVHHILASPLTAPSTTYPVYVRTSGSTSISRDRLIQIYPTTIASTATVVCNYIARPALAVWNYTVVNNQALYNASTSVSFELHPSEESEIVIKVLELAGISLKDPMLTQFSTAEEAQNIQQENK